MLFDVFVVCLVNGVLASAIPLYSFNQIQGLQNIPPCQQSSFNNIQNKIALLLQNPATRIQPYTQDFTSRNNNCPCRHQGPPFNEVNQLNFENILSHPILKSLLNPSPKNTHNENKVTRQTTNCAVSPKTASVINNYIIIPPEAFTASAKKKDVEKQSLKQAKLVKKSDVKPNRESKTKENQGNNKSGKDITERKEPTKADIGNKRKKPKKIRKNKNLLDKEVEVFDVTNSLKHKDEIKTISQTNSDSPETEIATKQKTLKSEESHVDCKNYDTCKVPSVKKNNNSLSEKPKPDKSKPKHLHDDFKLMNFHQMFPFFPENLMKNFFNKNGTYQFNQFDYAKLLNDNADLLRNYDHYFEQAPKTLIKKKDNTHKLSGNNNKAKYSKSQPTRINTSNSKNINKSSPTVILNVKKADNNTEITTSARNQNNTLGTAININLRKSRMKLEEPTVTLNPNASNSTEIITTGNAKDESLDTSGNVNLKSLLNEENVALSEADSMLSQEEILDLNKGISPAMNAKLTEMKEEIEGRKPSSITTESTKLTSMSKMFVENISVPELGSEDEVPVYDENDVIADYYPDFRNDHHTNLQSSEFETDDSSNPTLDNDFSQGEISRERRKFDGPLHDYNFFSHYQFPFRNYYKLHKYKDPAINEIPTTDIPKTTKSTPTTIEFERLISNVAKTEDSDEDVFQFITPPSLDKIDFQTRQINKGSQIKDVEYDEDEKIQALKRIKDVFVDRKSSTFSDIKSPKYNKKMTPKDDVQLLTHHKSPMFNDIETVYAHSKVARYGKAQNLEETLENPIDLSSDEENSSETVVDKPFVVIAQHVKES